MANNEFTIGGAVPLSATATPNLPIHNVVNGPIHNVVNAWDRGNLGIPSVQYRTIYYYPDWWSNINSYLLENFKRDLPKLPNEEQLFIPVLEEHVRVEMIRYG
jgi:hypothetical protein